jgi:hypothetical protein
MNSAFSGFISPPIYIVIPAIILHFRVKAAVKNVIGELKETINISFNLIIWQSNTH